MPDTLNTTAVARPGAFFGHITVSVREIARRLFSDTPGRTLDVGCGNGLFFAALGPSSQDYHGLDADRDLLVEARRVLSDNDVSATSLTVGNVTALPYDAGRFDHVYFLNTFVNIPPGPAVDRILDELCRVCCPGGRLITDIRNAWNPILAYRYRRHNRSASFVTHGYDLRRMRSGLRKRGFERVRSHPVGPRIPFLTPAFVIEATKQPAGELD